jgi:N utilization substance protein A
MSSRNVGNPHVSLLKEGVAQSNHLWELNINDGVRSTMKSEFILAFNEIAETRKLPREVILDALKAALVSAYRRSANLGTTQAVEARIDERTGDPSIWAEKEVVEDVQGELTEVSIEEARQLYPDVALGDLVFAECTPPASFGRIAAQTAKQVILQRMREAEREAQFAEYQERVGDLVTGTVQSNSNGIVTIGLGRTEALLPRNQQVPGERYRMHDKVRAYVMEVKKSSRGPQIVVSRTHRNMLRRLLEYEVPEIYNGAVEIKSIAREPGARSKVAVAAIQEGADPVGACVGVRGVRIQSIVKELNGEKIDVIEWNPDQGQFISKALSPARVGSVFLDDDPDDGRTAIVVVPDDQLSLAIGREGQNARLAAKLTGWRIDIKSTTEAATEAYNRVTQNAAPEEFADTYQDLTSQVAAILEKKAANRAVTPEEFQVLSQFTNHAENFRLGLREDERAERQALREAAREKVPEIAYQYPLADTYLPLRVYNLLAEGGYEWVGDVMEAYYVDPDRLLGLSGFGPSALAEVGQMVETIEFDDLLEAATIEETEEEAVVEALTVAEMPQVEEAPIKPVEEAAAVTQEAWADAEELAKAERAALVARLSGQIAAEAPADEPVVETEALEPVAEALPQEHAPRVVDAAEDEFVEEDFVDSDDVDELAAHGEKKAKQRRRQLVFDEDLGQVVARRKRKPGRVRDDWEDYVD